MFQALIAARTGMAAFVILFGAPEGPEAQPQKTVGAQPRPATTISATVQSNQRARRVLEDALQAAGGREALGKIENIRLKFDGEIVHRNQSHRPEPPYERTRTWGEQVIDLKGNRLMSETRGSWVGGFNWGSRTIFDGKRGVSFDLYNKRATTVPESVNLDQQRQHAVMQRFPHALLLRAKDRETDVRYMGSATFQGRPHDVIAFPGPTGNLWTIYIDSKTHLVSKYEDVTEDAVVGDTVREVVFGDYRKQGSVTMPMTRTMYVAGELTGEQKYTEVAFNAEVPPEAFAPLAGYPEPKAQPRPGDPLTKFAENVYQFRTNSGYNVLFVGFKDHVFVMEAPGSPRAAKDILAKARELFPDKPVKAVAVTHFHDDHAGAAKGFIDENITIITTAGNSKYFKRVGDSSSTAARGGTKIETVNGKRILTDGQITVELIDIGKGPHADEMLIAYLPAQKLVFQGDLLNRPMDGAPQAGNDTTVHFAERLKALGLEVDTVAGVHGPAATRRELESAIQLHEARLRDEQKKAN